MMALKDGAKEIVEILLRCPRVDLDVVDINKKHLEEINETLEETEIDELPEDEREEQRELNINRTYILVISLVLYGIRIVGFHERKGPIKGPGIGVLVP